MMFIDFRDLLGFASIGFFVTLFFAAFGALPLLIPVLMVILGATAIGCARMRWSLTQPTSWCWQSAASSAHLSLASLPGLGSFA